MKKGLIKILFANIISLVINILNSFLLPKYLSVDTYAILKTYTFYVGYAGFLSLGFADGMYLKYGGEELKNIDYKELGTSLRSYIVMEGIICSLMAVIALAMGNLILLAVAIGAFFINIIGYYKNLYQAVGEYGLYGRSLNYQTILLFLTNHLSKPVNRLLEKFPSINVKPEKTFSFITASFVCPFANKWVFL